MSIETIPSVLAERAGRAPNAVALLAPERAPLGYGALTRVVDETIQKLNSLGIGRNDRVAVVLPNGPEMAVAFLAVASAATFAPLNPGYRAKEFEFYLTDLRAKALLIGGRDDSPAIAVAQALGIPVIDVVPALDKEAGVFSLSPRSTMVASRPNDACRPDDVALVLHTSGTTAKPKMVPLTHGNLCCSARNIRQHLALVEEDRSLNIMPLFHIHGLIGALLSSIAAGASVVCSPGFLAPKFFEWLADYHPTWYTAVPTMHQGILARAERHADVIARHPLRFIRSSSSALAPQVMADLERTFRTPVVEGYGMTEASHQIACNPLPPLRRKPGSVGVPAGPEIAIMDESGGMLQSGRTGEIVLRGANLLGGYEADQETNRRAFTDGWFRTGDQGYLDEDGYLFITGRIKEIISRGGLKVSPREIDEVLLDHPGVAQAVAFAIPDPALGEEIGAAVVLRENVMVSERALREFVATRLADYKVPRHFRIVNEIPLGPTGKLQRIGMAERLGVTAAQALTRADYVAPRTPTEQWLAELWIQVLGVESAGATDNFFQLGGDSMLATLMASRIREIMGLDVTILTVFEAPTIAELANALASDRQWTDGVREEITGVLDGLEKLSDEDARELLAQAQSA